VAGAAVRGYGIWLVTVLVLTVTLLAGGISVAVRGWPQDDSARSEGVSPPRQAGPSTAALPLVAPPLVQVVGDAGASPDAAAVAALLQRHFDAINHRDYPTWKQTVTARRVDAVTPDRWQTNYRSTSDAQVVVSGITPTDSGDVVDLTFASTQDLQDAPSDLRVARICWTSRWPVVGGLLDTPAAGATTKHAC
jgi:hypothetical protein